MGVDNKSVVPTKENENMESQVKFIDLSAPFEIKTGLG